MSGMFAAAADWAGGLVAACSAAPCAAAAIRRAGGGGIGTIIVILIVAWLLGINPLALLLGEGGVTTGPAPQGQQTGQQQAGVTDEMRDFVATVLADTEDTWSAIFTAAGEDYPEPTLTLFSNSVESACGYAGAATGPVLLPGGPEPLHRPQFLRSAQEPLRCPRRFRSGLRARA